MGSTERRPGRGSRRATAEVLQALDVAGWSLVRWHPLPGGEPVVVLAGPTGVCLLVVHDRPVRRAVVRLRRGPGAGSDVVEAARVAAAGVAHRLAAAGAGRWAVEPVVVLEGAAERRPDAVDGAIPSSALAKRLTDGEAVLSEGDVRRVAAALRRLAALDEPVPVVLPGVTMPLLPG